MAMTAMTAVTTKNIAMMPMPPVDDGVDTRPITGLPVGAAATSSSCNQGNDSSRRGGREAAFAFGGLNSQNEEKMRRARRDVLYRGNDRSPYATINIIEI